MFERALELEPDYVDALLGLVWTYEHRYQVTDDTLYSGLMRRTLNRAYALDSLRASTNAVKGYAAYEYDNDADGAFRYLRRALELNPNDDLVYMLPGYYLLYLGLYEQAIPYIEKAYTLDPQYFWSPYKLGWCYSGIGDFDEAGRHFDKYFELAPLVMIFPGRAIALEIKRGNIEKVRSMIARTEAEHPEYGLLPYTKALLLAAEGKKDEALALCGNSEVYALLGMAPEAVEALGREIRGTARIPCIYYLDLVHNPFYDKIRGDAAFQRLVRREKSLYDEYVAKYGIL